MRNPFSPGTRLTGWRYALLVGGFFGSIALVAYPITIGPMIDPSPYKNAQKVSRAGIRQEDIQPGNMRVWSDPFQRKKPDS